MYFCVALDVLKQEASVRVTIIAIVSSPVVTLSLVRPTWERKLPLTTNKKKIPALHFLMFDQIEGSFDYYNTPKEQ